MEFKHISTIAYEKYQQDWMKNHGYTEDDVVKIKEEYTKQCEEENEPITQEGFDVYFFEFGFPGGEIFVCMSEFEDNEFQNWRYMKYLLSPEEYERWRKRNKEARTIECKCR